MSFSSWLLRRGHIGFDLGAGGIRAVEVEGRPGRWQVRSAVVRPLPSGAIRDGAVLVPGTVIAALSELAGEQGWRGREVFCALGGSRLITRHFLLPAMPREELDKAARFEAEQYLPLGTAELSLDFAVLGKERDEEGEKWAVLLAAFPMDTVRTYAGLFEASGLSLAALDIVPLAWQRVLVAALGAKSLEGQAVGLLDVGYSCTHIVIVQGARVELCRSLPRGWGTAGPGSAAYEVAATASPRRETLPGASPPEGTLEGIMPEVRRSVDFFRAQRRVTVWGGFYLGGALGGSGEACARVEAEIGIPVRPLWPLVEALSARPEAAVALGTALRQVIV